jgi:predicted Rossmann fold nucleotide-binding protein DprA/Smf involved in DNA uptake
MERVAIVGTRKPDSPTHDAVVTLIQALPEGTVIVTGGANGVDMIACEMAERLGLPLIVFWPEGMESMLRNAADRWGRAPEYTGTLPIDPKQATLARNTLIAVACTRMVAFVRGSQGGTWDAVRQAKRFDRPCQIIR